MVWPFCRDAVRLDGSTSSWNDCARFDEIAPPELHHGLLEHAARDLLLGPHDWRYLAKSPFAETLHLPGTDSG